MWREFQAIREEIVRRRDCGRVTCALRETSVPFDSQCSREVLDEFVGTLGFRKLAERWIEVGLQDAEAIVREVLRKDLAYGVSLMSDDDATRLASRFLGLFDESVRFYTNGNLVLRRADPKGVPGAWSPITEATFDTGVACVDDSRTGILWAEDED